MTATAGAPADELGPGRYTTVDLRTYRIVRAAGGTAGDLLVYAANGRAAVARLRGPRIVFASAPRVEDDVLALLEAPAAAAGRFTTRTKRCSRCNRPIKGPGPHGPKCERKESS